MLVEILRACTAIDNPSCIGLNWLVTHLNRTANFDIGDNETIV